MLNGRRQPSLGRTSRVNREVYARFCERLAVRFRGPTRQPKLAAVIPWIDGILEVDQKAPRKQRHTAHRIWTWLKEERPEVDVAESTVREYVRKRKIELGLEHGEVFVPQSYRWGQEGQ